MSFYTSYSVDFGIYFVYRHIGKPNLFSYFVEFQKCFTGILTTYRFN